MNLEVKVNPEVKQPTKGRIYNEQYKLDQFMNDFESRSQLDQGYDSFKELRSHSFNFVGKKPISISKLQSTKLTTL
jgi:hypothetical protein